MGASLIGSTAIPGSLEGPTIPPLSRIEAVVWCIKFPRAMIKQGNQTVKREQWVSLERPWLPAYKTSQLFWTHYLMSSTYWILLLNFSGKINHNRVTSFWPVLEKSAIPPVPRVTVVKNVAFNYLRWDLPRSGLPPSKQSWSGPRFPGFASGGGRYAQSRWSRDTLFKTFGKEDPTKTFEK